jgi:hypothetical protein
MYENEWIWLCVRMYLYKYILCTYIYEVSNYVKGIVKSLCIVRIWVVSDFETIFLKLR